ncbi:hypothetical protein LCGC14_0478410 [marine sediment metagenome]|uniref:Uncharacterized protein n=1 Tax=marine sediment metagenome TaxID=412755 RepID=A0A0F9SSY6_9ZZZZ
MHKSNPAFLLLVFSILAWCGGIIVGSFHSETRFIISANKIHLHEKFQPKGFDTVMIGAEALDWPRFRRFLDDCLESYEE